METEIKGFVNIHCLMIFHLWNKISHTVVAP